MNTRILVLGGLLPFALAMTHDAHANLSDAPRYADLPVGRFTTPPTKKVGYVGARESVPGLFVVAPPSFGVPESHRTLAIVADPKIVPGIKRGEGWSAAENPSACVTGSRGFSFSDFDGSEPRDREWPENLSFEGEAQIQNSGNPMSGVTAVHVERIVDQNGTVTLEATDAWVDPATRGARLISKSSVPLKLVRGPMFGMTIYAGRDERPDGKKFVQFVAVRSPSAESARTGQMWSMRQDGTVSHSSGCGHARIGLPVNDTMNDTATFVATVVLSVDGKPPKLGDKPVAAQPSRSVKTTPRLAPQSSESEMEIRSRMLHVQVSVSKTTRDKDPLVSVSSSWAGREQVERTSRPDPVE